MEKGVDSVRCIAGAHLTHCDLVKGFEFESKKKFGIKLASGFLTVLVAAAGGALTVATAGGTAAVTAIALIVYIGESNEAQRMKRWSEVVSSAMEKYENIRDRKLGQIQSKSLKELERFVMANAYHDLEDVGLVKTYRWKANNQTVTARYPTHKLKQLLRYVVDIDETLGKGLWMIDLLEITRVYPEETRGLWHTIEVEQGLAQKMAKAPSVKEFNRDQVRNFMRRQIDSHMEVDKKPTSKAEGIMAEKREQMINRFANLSEVVDGEEEYHDEMEEGLINVNATAMARKIGR